MYKLEDPLFLLLLPLLAVLGYFLFRGRSAAVYSSFLHISKGGSLRTRLIFLPELFLLLGMTGLIITLARPVYYKGNISDLRKGVLMEMVLDRSGSMGTWMDTEKEKNRLDIAKSAFLDFVENRRDDIIGITIFAGFPDTLSPLTVSHNVFPPFIDSVHLAVKDEDGTAMGDALALAVARIESFRASNPDDTAQDAVIILLTDGQNNSGNMTPLDAADMAAERGITVYTIGFGGGYYQNAFGLWQKIPPEYEVDSETLSGMAEKTGGQYFNAEDENSLKSIYEKIDKLEKTEIENISFTERRELYQFFLIICLSLILLSLVLSELIFPVVEERL